MGNGWKIEWKCNKPYIKSVEKLEKKIPNVKEILQIASQAVRACAESGISAGDKRFGDRLVGCEDFELYKLRLPVKQLGLSKSKGIRYIYSLLRDKEIMVSLNAYLKSDKEDLSSQEKKELLECIQEYLETGFDDCKKKFKALL